MSQIFFNINFYYILILSFFVNIYKLIVICFQFFNIYVASVIQKYIMCDNKIKTFPNDNVFNIIFSNAVYNFKFLNIFKNFFNKKYSKVHIETTIDRKHICVIIDDINIYDALDFVNLNKNQINKQINPKLISVKINDINYKTDFEKYNIGQQFHNNSLINILLFNNILWNKNDLIEIKKFGNNMKIEIVSEKIQDIYEKNISYFFE